MPLSPSETTALLDSLGHLPKKKLGQNFLIDGNIVDKSIQLADLPESSIVVEMGPGLGTLTRTLLESGQTVHAVELDQRLADNLENTEAEAITGQQLTITRGDAVKLPLGFTTPVRTSVCDCSKSSLCNFFCMAGICTKYRKSTS